MEMQFCHRFIIVQVCWRVAAVMRPFACICVHVACIFAYSCNCIPKQSLMCRHVRPTALHRNQQNLPADNWQRAGQKETKTHWSSTVYFCQILLDLQKTANVGECKTDDHKSCSDIRKLSAGSTQLQQNAAWFIPLLESTSECKLEIQAACKRLSALKTWL